MIIGQFNDSFQPIMDGVANVTRNYAYWLHKKYGSCYVVTPNFPKYEDCEAFEVIRYFSLPIPVRPPYRLGIPHIDLELRRKLKEIPFDLVHTHSPFSSGQLALKIARNRRIPIVATFHSKFYDDFKTATKSDVLAQFGVKQVINFFNSVDAVWTVNKATVETLREYGYKGAVDVVYNGIDFTPVSNFETRRQQIDELFTLSPQENVLLFVGQHIWQKNLKLLIQALHFLHQWGTSFKMIFVGTGFAEKAMKEQVQELGINNKVIFLGNLLDRELLKSLYARADLFLFPSIYDTAAIVVREAAAVQCPSVVDENANCAEGLIDNYNSFIAPNDAESYARKVKEVLSNRPHLSQVGEKAQQTLSRHWEQIIEEVAEKYQNLIIEYKNKERFSVSINY